MRAFARCSDPCAKAKRATHALLMQQLTLIRESTPEVFLPIGKTPIEMHVCFHLRSLKGQNREEFGQPHITCGDIDNYLKYLLDCFQPDIIQNDRYVWRVVCSKVHTDDPKTEVSLKW